MRMSSKVAALFAVVLVASGCAASIGRTPLPKALADKATVGDMANVRFWGDRVPPRLDQMIAEKQAQVIAAGRQPRGRNANVDFLALSGGGSDGAYGAGVLAGWSKTGKRPKFDVVTGVSTGALTAPFAFLGPSHDPKLREIYTTYSTKQLVTPQALAGILGASSIADNAGLRRLLKKYINPRVLRAIAVEHKRGRRLLIATTNLDAQRPVVWDMGAIAASNAPHSLDLFRNVMLASSALPGIFPPVIIKVRASGKNYQELHVDGGTVGQVFFLPQGTIKRVKKRNRFKRHRTRLFVILNGKFSPEWQTVKPTTIAIASRSMATLLKAQGNGDVFRLYSNAKANRIDFNLAAIPERFTLTTKEPFDPVYMKALFEQGYRDAVNGYKWKKTPPGNL